MEKRVAIELKNLSIGYKTGSGETEILTGINASLLRGELTCLIGSNGAGKSTLLRTIAGFLPQLAGEVIIEGKYLSEYSDSQLAKIISVVLTDRISLNNVSVRQIVEMGRSPYTGFWGNLGKEDKEKVDEALELVGISHIQNRWIDSISDGERQKAMIAKALAQSTPVIILDEPSAFLDYPSKAELMSLLASLAHSKDKMIFQSTHDLDIALQIADKVWLLDRDKGLTIGTPSALGNEGHLNRYFDRPTLIYQPTSERFIVKT